MGFVIVKSTDKYVKVAVATAITVAEMLPTRPPMKLGERPMVSAYKGVVIIFLAIGITTPNLQSSLPLVSAF